MSNSEDLLLDKRGQYPCRVCNVQSKHTVDLFQLRFIAGELTTMAASLSYCINMQVSEEDEDFLPKHICKPCALLLTQFMEFKHKALRTDILLRETQNTRAFKLAKLRNPTSPAKSVGTVPPATEIDSVESADSDEFVYVLEETESVLMETQQQQEQPLTEEVSEDEPHVEVFEVDLDLADDDDDSDEQEEKQIHIQEANSVKLRGTHRRKTVNAALLCPICGKQLSTSNSYKYHMQLHGDDRPFVCKICGESFKTRNAHDGHITVHNPNNPNKCRICGKTYRQASSLRSHLHTHSGIKPFVCNICGKGLTQKSGYKKHMLIHTGEKPHFCETCGRNFRYSSNLIAHKRSHTRRQAASPTKNAI